MSDAVQTASTHADAEFAKAVEQGIAAAEAGQLVDYEAVRRWLLSWGTEAEGPPPPCA